ncbi:hypothetical protein [Saccharopolyspora erythraea]|uniref:Secreted protein n=1 Tax=Saccharopolyspora erythraea (strain ATCC 11635 / DSM 40517 / JCM 4748 / NBRC 13426 / NCIMB 8594 / NRRL 2338) TaxID=405948 RepID=A4FH37_SACEN|nr:hypothetical protein [Saccharopolyspora erythraea]QRK87272.1 hypothetical protein JQX30_20795 [Saccharopolyspora erythraea]CAM03362.1 hypothetical protein SACE_4091 [Saccharopolyspora erythraea NRRL 2338]
MRVRSLAVAVLTAVGLAVLGATPASAQLDGLTGSLPVVGSLLGGGGSGGGASVFEQQEST